MNKAQYAAILNFLANHGMTRFLLALKIRKEDTKMNILMRSHMVYWKRYFALGTKHMHFFIGSMRYMSALPRGKACTKTNTRTTRYQICHTCNSTIKHANLKSSIACTFGNLVGCKKILTIQIGIGSCQQKRNVPLIWLKARAYTIETRCKTVLTIN